MEFFKKRSTAWAVLAVTIVACFFIGQAKKPAEEVITTPAEPQEVPVGTYIQDNANVIDDATEKYITKQINGLVNATGVAEIQIYTVDTADGEDLYDIAVDVADKVNLSGSCCVMVFAVDDVDASIVAGQDIDYYFTDSDLSYILNSNLTEEDFESRNLSDGIKNCLDDLIDMYEEYYNVKVTGSSTLNASSGQKKNK